MKFSTDFSGRIIQVVEALDVGDAVSNQVIAIDELLGGMGLDSHIVVKWMHHDVRNKCVTMEELTPGETDVIIYHAAGFSEHSLRYALAANCTRILLYHNITPHDFFDEGSDLHYFCKNGREQLAEVIFKFHHHWADSQYNLDELISLGAPKDGARVVPIIVDAPDDPPRVEKESGSWLFLGRVATNKGQDELVRIFLEANRQDPTTARKLYLVGRYSENEPYYRSLKEAIDTHDAGCNIVLTGKVDEQRKEALLERSAVLVSLSRHEGFGVPLVEAPLRGTPVVALSGTAVDETMGGGSGLASNVSEVKTLAMRAAKDPKFRKKLLAEQIANAKRFRRAVVAKTLREVLESILPKPNHYRTASIVICTLDRRDFLERCLDYLAYQSNPSFEVVVVDGPSTDGTKALLEQWEGRIKIVHNPERNLAISRNLGADAAAGDIIAFIDDDAIPFADWVETIRREFNRRPLTNAALGGPAYYAGSLNFQIEDIGFNKFAEAVPNIDSRRIGSNGLFRSLIGTNTAFTRTHLSAVGGFDEQYDYFLDESDLTFRLQSEGWLVSYCPDLYLRHEFARSDNRKSRFTFNWFSITKNTAYFVALYSGLQGKKLRDYLTDRLQKERVAPLDAAFEEGQISAKQHAKMVREIWHGMEQGIDDSRRGILTRKISECPPDFLPFETRSDFPSVGVDIRRLHICIVSKEFPPFGAGGGIGTLYYHLASELLLLGHEVTVILPSDTSGRFDQGRFHIRHVERGSVDFGDQAPATGPNLSWSLRATAAVANLHAEHPVDVIDSALWDTEALALALVDQPRPPLVVRLVTPFSVAAEANEWSLSEQVSHDFIAAEKALIDHADAVVGISDSIVRTISERYGRRPDSRWSVNHCGVAYWPAFDWTADYDELSGEKEIGRFVQQFDKIVLFVGRLERRKGLDTLIAAAATFLRKRKDVGLIVSGQDIEGWEAKTREILPEDVRSRILFTGSVSDPTRDKLMARSYCLVFPSRYESFGLVPLEAFAHGVPVVAARAGAIPEVVLDESAGLLFDPEDPDDLAAKVTAVLDDPQLRDTLSDGARQSIRRLSGRASAIRSIELYASLLGQKILYECKPGENGKTNTEKSVRRLKLRAG